jgi:hypothetical protein
MKRLVSSFFIFVLLFTVSFKYVSAKVISENNGHVVIGQNEVVDDDLFIGSKTAEIDGTVNGDVFVAAETLKITGVVNGNLHAGANTIDLMGKVKGNAYLGGQNVFVTGATIGGSLLIGAATASTDKSTTIGGAFISGAGGLSLDSVIGRGAYLGVGTLTLGDNTKIGKDLYYATGDKQGDAGISEKAKISGNVYKTQVDTQRTEQSKMRGQRFMRDFHVGSTIVSYLGALVIGFLYFNFFAKSFTESAASVSKSFWKSMGVGFLSVIALIPGLIILLITVVGIPVAGIIVLIFMLLGYLAKLVVGLALGNWLQQKFNWKFSLYGSFAFGLFAVYFLKTLPFVGFLTGLVVFLLGLGSLILNTFKFKEKANG